MTLVATDTMEQTDRQPASWVRWLDPSDKVLAALLLAPAGLLLSLIIVYPVGRLFWMSFQNLSLTSGFPPPSPGSKTMSSCGRTLSSGTRPATRSSSP